MPLGCQSQTLWTDCRSWMNPNIPVLQQTCPLIQRNNSLLSNRRAENQRRQASQGVVWSRFRCIEQGRKQRGRGAGEVVSETSAASFIFQIRSLNVQCPAQTPGPPTQRRRSSLRWPGEGEKQGFDEAQVSNMPPRARPPRARPPPPPDFASRWPRADTVPCSAPSRCLARSPA